MLVKAHTTKKQHKLEIERQWKRFVDPGLEGSADDELRSDLAFIGPIHNSFNTHTPNRLDI